MNRIIRNTQEARIIEAKEKFPNNPASKALNKMDALFDFINGPKIDESIYKFDEPTGLVVPRDYARIYYEKEFVLSYPGYDFLNGDPLLVGLMTSPKGDVYNSMARWYAINGGYKAKKERWYYNFVSYCKTAQPRALVAGAMFYVQLKCIISYFSSISIRFIEEVCKNKFYPEIESALPQGINVNLPWSKGRKCYADYKSVLHYWAALIFCGYPSSGYSSTDSALKFYSTAASFYKLATSIQIKEFQNLDLHRHPLFPLVPWQDMSPLAKDRHSFHKIISELHKEYLREKKYSERAHNYSKRIDKKASLLP